MHHILGLEGNDTNTVKMVVDGLIGLRGRLTCKPIQGERDTLRAIIARIDIEPGQLTLTLSLSGVRQVLGCGRQDRRSDAESPLQADGYVIKLPFDVRRRGVESRLVIGGEQQEPASVDQRLVDLIARAADWMKRLSSGACTTTAELGRLDGVDDGEISRVMPLAFLAPDIVEAIIQGRQPIALTARYLKRLKPLPASWVDQRRLLRFEVA